jgi:hypothetical protein
MPAARIAGPAIDEPRPRAEPALVRSVSASRTAGGRLGVARRWFMDRFN